MTTQTKNSELSETATIIHERHQSQVTLLTAKTDGMSAEDWETDETKMFSGDGHKRRALAYAVSHSEDDYDEVQIDNRAKKANLRKAVEEATSQRKAAKALAEYLRYLDIGGEVLVDHEWNVSHVTWVGGPYEWALAFSGGSSIYSGELGHGESKFDFYKIERNINYHLEAKNASTVSFYG